VAAATAGVLAAAVMGLALLVGAGWSPLLHLDGRVERVTHTFVLRHPSLVTTLQWLTNALAPFTWRLLVLAAVVVLVLRGQRRSAVWAGAAMGVAGVLGPLLKAVVDRKRPLFPNPVSHAAGLSFPSGHAVNSAAGAAVLLGSMLLLGLLQHRALRVAATVAAVVLPLITGATRVLLGVHYVSDVVGGWLLALAVVAAGLAIVAPVPAPPRRG
jgi:membrane-associated phospholipid phosphatase